MIYIRTLNGQISKGGKKGANDAEKANFRQDSQGDQVGCSHEALTLTVTSPLNCGIQKARANNAG